MSQKRSHLKMPSPFAGPPPNQRNKKNIRNAMNEENSLCYYFIFYVIKQIRNLTVTISYIDI